MTDLTEKAFGRPPIQRLLITAKLFNDLSSACHLPAATAGGAPRKPRQFGLAGRVARQARMLALLRSSSKGRNHCFADRDKSRAWPFDTGALAADAGTFEEQRQGVGQQIGFRNPGASTEARQAIALRRLEFLDYASRRMIALGQLDRRIGQVAAAAIAEHAFGAAANPSMQLRERIIGMSGFKSVPDRLGLPGDLAQAGDHQIVLRAEVTIQRHLVGPGRLGDRFDPDGADAVAIKQLAGGRQNAGTRGDFLVFAAGWRHLRKLAHGTAVLA
jgi:hypothetical protein